MQSNHVIDTVKHYALNDQETDRGGGNFNIDEAALRMSDLLAFEIAIERGKPGSVMCAYNRVNGVHACESPFLLTEVLAQRLGLAGLRDDATGAPRIRPRPRPTPGSTRNRATACRWMPGSAPTS